MEYETDKKGGWVERLRESPRTVSALIIILVVAAAIYAFSGENDLGQVTPEDETNGAEITLPGEEAEEEDEGEAVQEITPAPAPESRPALQPVDQTTLRQSVRDLPAGQETEAGYVETAQSGDGITHLARRATTRYLASNNAGYAVTNEHRVFIEDYIQNRIGTEGLEIGETRALPFDLMREAVAAAGQLNEQQLRNLSQYASALAT